MFDTLKLKNVKMAHMSFNIFQWRKTEDTPAAGTSESMNKTENDSKYTNTIFAHALVPSHFI